MRAGAPWHRADVPGQRYHVPAYAAPWKRWSSRRGRLHRAEAVDYAECDVFACHFDQVTTGTFKDRPGMRRAARRCTSRTITVLYPYIPYLKNGKNVHREDVHGTYGVIRTAAPPAAPSTKE